MKDGSHKIKIFDNPIEKMKMNLLEIKEKGNERHISVTHIADCMTKPLPLEAHKYLTNKILSLGLDEAIREKAIKLDT